MYQRTSVYWLNNIIDILTGTAVSPSARGRVSAYIHFAACDRVVGNRGEFFQPGSSRENCSIFTTNLLIAEFDSPTDMDTLDEGGCGDDDT